MYIIISINNNQIIINKSYMYKKTSYHVSFDITINLLYKINHDSK